MLLLVVFEQDNSIPLSTMSLLLIILIETLIFKLSCI